MPDILNQEMHFEDSLIEFQLNERKIQVRFQTTSNMLEDILEDFKSFMGMCGYPRNIIDKIQLVEGVEPKDD